MASYVSLQDQYMIRYVNKSYFSKGDSGGPLIYYKGQQPIQIGVAEITTNWCGYNYTSYAGFISVSLFRDWIDSILSMP